MIDIEKNKRRIANPAVLSAFETLVRRAAECGLEMRDITGFITGVKFYKDGAYVFASQTNRHHLTFYIRRPAMRRWGPFEDRARRKFPSLTLNKSREIKIHLRAGRDAGDIADWLFRLP